MKPRTLLIGVLLLSWLLHSQMSNAWVDYDRSVTVHTPPKQGQIDKAPFNFGEFTIVPRASFDIEARVLSRKAYLFGTESKLSPVDFAMGWGPMSNYHVLKDLRISQNNRWYFYRYREAPIMPSEIIRNSANMHMIPADKYVKKKLMDVRRGRIVRIKGYLVNVRGPNGWHWNSSMTRTDNGNGSCEIIFVEDIEIQS
ncbi:MAG: hypothetical protein H6756_05115 [Candidatus Omnitrophica bacterium]|nr:hypothetical protein [Candidatus Omnitrophota bacterium]